MCLSDQHHCTRRSSEPLAKCHTHSSQRRDELKLYSEIMKPEPVPDLLLPLIELLCNSKFKIRSRER
uniref:Alternative protein RALB n=1 Tax=Homo sapiens TaxID=9606 RepID=L8E7S5_HUMAN|nr:alternative protein RALB [Homo sapiens]